MTMQYFADANHSRHRPAFFLARGRPVSSPESPQRAQVLGAALAQAGIAVQSPESLDEAVVMQAVRRIHSDDYLGYLQSAWRRWQALPNAGNEVVPNVHPGRYTRGCLAGLDNASNRLDLTANHIVAEAGYYQADAACPIGEHTFSAALAAANVALSAAGAIATQSATSAYALCRPPGHHAHADQAGGFCFLNNCAVATAQLLNSGFNSAAIVDVDVHHGNGTQTIFYARNDVLTASLHGDPGGSYPFYLGYSDEQGAGPGKGFNINQPLCEGTGDEAYVRALENLLLQVEAYRPAVLVVALGLDAAGDDPLAFLDISATGFAEIGKRLGALGLPTLCVQEGGYLSANLGVNLVAFLAGFNSEHERRC